MAHNLASFLAQEISVLGVPVLFWVAYCLHSNIIVHEESHGCLLVVKTAIWEDKVRTSFMWGLVSSLSALKCKEREIKGRTWSVGRLWVQDGGASFTCNNSACLTASKISGLECYFHTNFSSCIWFRLSHNGLIQRAYLMWLTSFYKQCTCSINNGRMTLCFLLLHYGLRNTWNKGTTCCWVLSQCSLFDSPQNGPAAFKWRAYHAFGNFVCFQRWDLRSKLQSQDLTVLSSKIGFADFRTHRVCG